MDFKLKGTRMGLKMQAYGIWDMGEMGSAPQPPIFEDEEGTWWGTLPIQWLVTPATSLPSEAADPY